MDKVVIFLDILGVLIPKTDSSSLKGLPIKTIANKVSKECVRVLNVFLRTNFSQKVDFEIYVLDKFAQYYTRSSLLDSFDKNKIKLTGVVMDDAEVHKYRKYKQTSLCDFTMCKITENLNNLQREKCFILTAQKDLSQFKEFGELTFSVDFESGLTYKDYFDMYEFFENKVLNNNKFKYS